MNTVSMREMLEAGVHFGHQVRYWNPKMAPYIFGVRHKIHIINLEHSLPLFHDAQRFVASVARNRGRVMFVGTKHSAREVVREEAERCGMPYVDYRWLGGMLTNYKTIRQSIKRLKELESIFENNKTTGMTKKESLNLMREKTKLDNNLRGIKNMGGLPDALFVIDTGHEKIAINEARRLGIPVVGIVDTNACPDNIDYMIPGNDDALRSIRLYCSVMADTIIDARGAVDIEKAKNSKAEPKKAEDKAVKKVVTKKSKLEKSDEPAAAEDEKAVKPDAKPAAKKAPAEKKAAAAKPAAKKAPAEKKAAAAKPAAKKAPTEKKAAAAKPAAKKPAAKKEEEA